MLVTFKIHYALHKREADTQSTETNIHLHLPLLYPSPAMSTGTHIRQVWGQCQGQKPRSSSQIQCFHYSRIRKFSAASRMTTMGPLCMGKKQKYLTHKTSFHQFIHRVPAQVFTLMDYIYTCRSISGRGQSTKNIMTTVCVTQSAPSTCQLSENMNANVCQPLFPKP